MRAMLKFAPALCALCLIISAAAAAPEGERARLDAAIARVTPALVQIYVVTADFDDGRQLKSESSGSGAIIREDGYIVSNHHVAGHGLRLLCILSNNEEIEAELVGTDAMSDISVLRLKGAPGRKYPFVRFGNSDLLQVGDPVLALGSPMALSQSVTRGIVSNVKLVMPRFSWPSNRFTLDGEDVGSIVRWIAHDAAIFPGNSGGPLVNLDGDVVGVNEISLGLSGAIPGNLAREVVDTLIRTGRVERAWLGIEVQPLLKSGRGTNGVLVSGTTPGSPADAAGFQSGDLLVALAGQPVRVHYAEELPIFNQFVCRLPVGQPVPAVVARAGVEQTLTLTPVAREETLPKEKELVAWGLTGRDLSRWLATELKLTNRAGVQVTSVRPGGPGGEAKPSLNPGDVITRIGEQAVTNLAELAARTAALTADQDEPVPALVTFRRQGAELVTVVKLGVQEIEDPGLEVKKAWLPVAYQVIGRDLAEAFGLGDAGGVRVTQVYPGSTAEQAGLRVGDLLLKVDGEPIAAFQPEDQEVLTALIRQYPVGTAIELTVRRGTADQMIKVPLARAPRLEREMKSFRDERFEFAVREVTFFDRVREEWKDEPGLVVKEVESGGWAALGRLAVGDLLQRVDGQPVPTIAELKAQLDRVAGARARAVVLTVRRGIHTRFVELEPDWSSNVGGGT
jgi:serine protease Do